MNSNLPRFHGVSRFFSWLICLWLRRVCPSVCGSMVARQAGWTSAAEDIEEPTNGRSGIHRVRWCYIVAKLVMQYDMAMVCTRWVFPMIHTHVKYACLYIYYISDTLYVYLNYHNPLVHKTLLEFLCAHNDNITMRLIYDWLLIVLIFQWIVGCIPTNVPPWEIPR